MTVSEGCRMHTKSLPRIINLLKGRPNIKVLITTTVSTTTTVTTVTTVTTGRTVTTMTTMTTMTTTTKGDNSD